MTFEVTPEGATVVVKDSQNLEMTAETDGTYELEAGTYNYTVSAEGYVEKTETFVVKTEAQTVAVDLEKDPSYVTTSAELEAALKNEELIEITIDGTIGDKDNYAIYTLERNDVTIKGSDGAKVFGTFIVKADGVTIDNLAIQNKGDLKGESTTNRGGIYVFANNVTLTNNTITNGLGENEGLSNAIQLMSPREGNQLSKYVITDNKLIGHDNEVTNWSSSGIVIAQNYTPGSIGEDVKAITATSEDYKKILENNTFTNNKIDLTHQDWTKDLEGGPVLYVHPE